MCNIFYRKIQPEMAPAILSVPLINYRPLHVLHKFSHQCEAKAMAMIFGGVKWCEHIILPVSRNAIAIIANSEFHGQGIKLVIPPSLRNRPPLTYFVVILIWGLSTCDVASIALSKIFTTTCTILLWLSKAWGNDGSKSSDKRILSNRPAVSRIFFACCNGS